MAEPDRDARPAKRRRRSHAAASAGRIVRNLSILVALTVLYYAVPMDGGLGSTAEILLTTILLIAGVVVITVLAALQLRELREQGEDASVKVQSLLALAYVAIVLFAGAYYSLASATTDQFVGLETKTDALYFTVTTLATLGYGDVYAAGQGARAVVVFQVVFNLVVIGGLISTVGNVVRHRPRRR